MFTILLQGNKLICYAFYLFCQQNLFMFLFTGLINIISHFQYTLF